MRKPATAHVFKASVKDKPGVYEGIWFDASLDTKESAEKSFVPLPNGEGYLYDGVVYSDVDYIGVFSESAMPRNDSDCLKPSSTMTHMKSATQADRSMLSTLRTLGRQAVWTRTICSGIQSTS